MSLFPNWLTPATVRDASALLPATAAFVDDELVIGGMGVSEALARFGSPLYLLDEADFKARATGFKDAFSPWDVYYASKAFLSRTVARWAHECGLGVDVCSHGELVTALQGGVPASSIGLHGVNKTDEELRAAIKAGVGRVIVDSSNEIDRIEAICAERAPGAPDVPVLVRVTLDVDAHTHAQIKTSVADQQFGFALAGGVAFDALARLHEMAGVALMGVHCHIGSQILQTDCYELAIERLIGLVARFRDATGVRLRDAGLGGGFGIAYTEADAALPPSAYASVMRGALEAALEKAGLEPMRVSIEPGRSIVGPSCVALYTVGTIKPVSLDDGVRTYVAVDGGMSDNPRPAFYQSEYTALLANRVSDAPAMLCRVVGHHCETGDILVNHAFLPADLRPGDVIAVPASGAYQRAMASNYNLSLRPPIVAVRDGAGTVLLRRDTMDDLLAIDVGW